MRVQEPAMTLELRGACRVDVECSVKQSAGKSCVQHKALWPLKTGQSVAPEDSLDHVCYMLVCYTCSHALYCRINTHCRACKCIAGHDFTNMNNACFFATGAHMLVGPSHIATGHEPLMCFGPYALKEQLDRQTRRQWSSPHAFRHDRKPCGSSTLRTRTRSHGQSRSGSFLWEAVQGSRSLPPPLDSPS